MRRWSLAEFKEMFDKEECEYLFSLDDQEDRLISSYITVFDMIFDAMLVSPSQNAVYFKALTGKYGMLIDGVRAVEEAHSSEIGTVFDLICKSRFDEERRYRFWARQPT